MTNDNKRGNLVAENDGGTLEHVGGRSYVGSATIDGKVVTKRFRRGDEDEADVAERWERWQGRKASQEEEPMDKQAEKRAGKPRGACPLSGSECAPSCPMWSAANGACAIMLGGVALFNLSANIGRLDMSEPLELLAMAVAESGGREAKADAPEAPTEEQGVEAYLDGKTFIAFVNLHSKTAYSPYRKFCEDNGYPFQREAEFTQTVLARFGELHAEKAHGGVRFAA